MESKRQQKFARVIQKELSDLFQREGLSFHEHTIITITQIRATPDLSVVRVYLSIFNAADPNAVLNSIKAQSKELRYKLGARIKNQVRIIPELEFFLDDSQEYASRMDKLFDDIHRKESDQ